MSIYYARRRLAKKRCRAFAAEEAAGRRDSVGAVQAPGYWPWITVAAGTVFWAWTLYATYRLLF